jgi:hypothetical protein
VDHKHGIVFRSRFGIGLTLGVWAICVAGIVSALISGAGVVPVVLLGTLGWFVWLAFWRPCVVTGDEGVELRNLVRDVEIPYDAIEDVETRFSLTIRAGGRAYSAWGAPAPSGASSMRDAMRRRPAADAGQRWKDAPRSVREQGTARPGDDAGTASGAPATVIRRELERRERSGRRSAAGAHANVRVRPALIVISAVAVLASIGAIVVGSIGIAAI